MVLSLAGNEVLAENNLGEVERHIKLSLARSLEEHLAVRDVLSIALFKQDKEAVRAQFEVARVFGSAFHLSADTKLSFTDHRRGDLNFLLAKDLDDPLPPEVARDPVLREAFTRDRSSMRALGSCATIKRREETSGSISAFVFIRIGAQEDHTNKCLYVQIRDLFGLTPSPADLDIRTMTAIDQLMAACVSRLRRQTRDGSLSSSDFERALSSLRSLNDLALCRRPATPL